MKKTVLLITVLILCFSLNGSSAERKTVVKDQYYLGAMRVVKCEECVSLRERPDKASKILAEVPLDAIVYYCTNNVKKYQNVKYKKQAPLFIKCEYEGQEGYILSRYLEPAPEFEPAETKQNNDLMTREQIIGNGQVALEWQEFNVSVTGAYETITEDDKTWEYMRVGCFIDDEPIWGYTEAVEQTGQYSNLKAFMAGTEDEPQVYVYDAQYGLISLDLMDGTEMWTLLKNDCSLGDAAVYAVDPESGMLFIAGSDGPDPVAITADGTIRWRSEIDDPEVYGPLKIIINAYDIDVIYESGKVVTLEMFDGEAIEITDQESKE